MSDVIFLKIWGQVQRVSGVTVLCSSPALQSADGAHSTMWGPDSEGMEGGACLGCRGHRGWDCQTGASLFTWHSGYDFRLMSERPVVFTWRREEGCVFVRVSVFTSVGLEDRGILRVYLSVKLSVLIRILEPDCLCTIKTSSVRHIYVTPTPITCIHIRTHNNKTLLYFDFYTVNITLST